MNGMTRASVIFDAHSQVFESSVTPDKSVNWSGVAIAAEHRPRLAGYAFFDLEDQEQRAAPWLVRAMAGAAGGCVGGGHSEGRDVRRAKVQAA